MTTDYIRQLQHGEARITVINIGDFQAPFADEWLMVPPGEGVLPTLTDPVPMPIQCFHVALPGKSLLVDASTHAISAAEASALPGFQPTPGLLAGLTEAGVNPAEITHVIITHGHFDHYNGITRKDNDAYTLCFPQARHYLGRADWELIQPLLQNPEAAESHTLGLVQAAGLLELVEGDRDLGDGVQIIAAPGETPGHQTVRLQSAGQTCYFLGDLYHHPIEVEYPTWMVNWNDFDPNCRSRQTLTQMALPESALLFATHIPTIGRLQQTDTGLRWEAVA